MRLTVTRARKGGASLFAVATLFVLALGGLGAAGLLSNDERALAVSVPSCELSVSEGLLSNYIVGQNKVYYAKQNPVEYAAVRAYLDGGSRPSTTGMTHMGLHLVYLEDTCRAPDVTTTVTTTGSTTTTTTQPTTTTTTTTTTTEPPPTTTEPPPPSGASVFLSPSGSDANPCTQTARCRSLQRSFNVAQPGQVVELAGGSYAGQSVSGSKGASAARVVFREASGATVLFSGRLVLQNLDHVELQGFGFSSTTDFWNLDIHTCNRDVVIRDFTGHAFFMFEGNRAISIVGGDWGNYQTGGTDNGIGTTGGTGPSVTCSWLGESSPQPVRNVVIDGVTFHDVHYPAGDGHSDCLQIQGNVDGLTVKNSTFIRCGNSSAMVETDQGVLFNITFENNVFRNHSNSTYYSVQFNRSNHNCGNIVFRGNDHRSENVNGVARYALPRPNCPAAAGYAKILIENNTFLLGPDASTCSAWKVNSTWRDNIFELGQACISLDGDG